MRMLLVNHLLDVRTGGGTAERTFQLGKALSNAGVETTFLTLDIGLSESRRQQLSFAGMVAVPCLNKRYFLPRLSIGQARKLVEKSDIVLLSGHWTVLNAIVAQACRRLGRPYFHAPAGALMPFGRSLWLKYLYDAILGRKLVRSAASWIAVTDAERSDFAAYGIDADCVQVIPNGINLQEYQSRDLPSEVLTFRDSSGVGPSRYVLFLGRLNSIKGPDILFEAFSKLAKNQPDLHLVMAGPDEGLMVEIKNRCVALGLDHRVHFPGFLQGAMKTVALREAALLVIPSRREAMSIVVLEAGACACPVLFTDACGLKNFANRGAGVMVGASSEAIAQAMELLLQDSDGKKNMALQLQKIVQEEYTWTVQAGRLINLAHGVSAASR